MKKIELLIVVSLMLTVNSCQAPIDLEAEKRAIIEVINAETEAYMDYDFEKVASYYIQDSLNFRLSTGADDHVFLEGWDQVEEFFKQDMVKGDSDSLSETNIKVEKDNYRIKLYERSAYVVCTEKWTYTTPTKVVEIDSRQVRFMEKEDGKWKIAFLSFVGTSGYDAEEKLEELGVEFNTVL